MTESKTNYICTLDLRLKSGNISRYLFCNLDVYHYLVTAISLSPSRKYSKSDQFPYGGKATIMVTHSEITQLSHLWRSTDFSGGEKNTVLGGIRKQSRPFIS